MEWRHAEHYARRGREIQNSVYREKSEVTLMLLKWNLTNY